MTTQANILEQHEQYVERVDAAVSRIQALIDAHENREYADEMQTFLDGVQTLFPRNVLTTYHDVYQHHGVLHA